MHGDPDGPGDRMTTARDPARVVADMMTESLEAIDPGMAPGDNHPSRESWRTRFASLLADEIRSRYPSGAVEEASRAWSDPEYTRLVDTMARITRADTIGKMASVLGMDDAEDEEEVVARVALTGLELEAMVDRLVHEWPGMSALIEDPIDDGDIERIRRAVLSTDG